MSKAENIPTATCMDTTLMSELSLSLRNLSMATCSKMDTVGSYTPRWMMVLPPKVPGPTIQEGEEDEKKKGSVTTQSSTGSSRLIADLCVLYCYIT